MQYKVRKNGSSLVVTIPPFVARALKLKDGDNIEIKLEKNYFIVKRGEK